MSGFTTIESLIFENRDLIEKINKLIGKKKNCDNSDDDSDLKKYIKEKSGGKYQLLIEEAGGGGDCLFHSIAYGINKTKKNNVDKLNLELLNKLPDYPNTMQVLRQIVADEIKNQSTFDFMNKLYSNVVVERIDGAWKDSWSPKKMLETHLNFKDSDIEDFMGTDKHGKSLSLSSESNLDNFLKKKGVTKTQIDNLKNDVSKQYGVCGWHHQGTEQDLGAISESLNMCFILLFSNSPSNVTNKGLNWINCYGGNYSNCQYIMIIHYITNTHYQLLGLKDCKKNKDIFLFSPKTLPTFINNLHNTFCNHKF